MDNEIVQRGRALLGLDAPPEPVVVLTERVTELAAAVDAMISRLEQLEQAILAPRVRTPVRDSSGRITSIVDTVGGM